MKEKASLQLLQIIGIYVFLNFLIVVLILYFELIFCFRIVPVWLMLSVGWLCLCILQYRVHCYESLIEQRNLLWDFARKSPAITARLKEVKKTISDFEKSFPLTTEIVKLLELE